VVAALWSLSGVADEVIVVDCFSTDHTLKVARRHTQHVFERKWTDFADQKNYAAGLVSRPWILSVDADERLSPELREELAALKLSEPGCAAFSMPRRAWYLGRWVRHSGWYPDRRVRLYKKDRARWEGDLIHERLAVNGAVERLSGELHHFPFAGVAEHAARVNEFSGLEAQKLYAAGRKAGWRHVVCGPPAAALRSYFLKLGFLDGFPGLVIAGMEACRVFLMFAKLKEIWRKGERIEPFPY